MYLGLSYQKSIICMQKVVEFYIISSEYQKILHLWSYWKDHFTPCSIDSINPIPGEVWNYVSWRGWVNLSHIYSQGSFSALEPPKSQKSCFHLVWIISNWFGLFWEFFFHKSQKNAKIENLTKKLLKNEWNFKILQFLTYINILYIKGKHFSCRIQFHKEKVWFYAKKILKDNFLDFFVKIEADQSSSTKNFLKL